VLRFNQSSSV